MPSTESVGTIAERKASSFPTFCGNGGGTFCCDSSSCCDESPSPVILTLGRVSTTVFIMNGVLTPDTSKDYYGYQFAAYEITNIDSNREKHWLIHHFDFLTASPTSESNGNTSIVIEQRKTWCRRQSGRMSSMTVTSDSYQIIRIS
ncbi:hypothetical protein TSTA_010230 [Talaromyces stipitatus ATCC 10500]|uniref:Uncharacterized protein n=1 Tax=Talaromyces stipitatus (strain ATCC 10500 / CBS 375.48 / QM 6759 / NRRL 1006) TaxID=441959 RepID=B8MG38_TALSN|nr:uncharacterized protein TSTA_010230 [Talaromyces stipitatus ATCC 10500]EED15905.1 hypothetical protein TSTA_010230 [Talaromyces stipitatus ATCC 10500]